MQQAPNWKQEFFQLSCITKRRGPAQTPHLNDWIDKASSFSTRQRGITHIDLLERKQLRQLRWHSLFCHTPCEMERSRQTLGTQCIHAVTMGSWESVTSWKKKQMSDTPKHLCKLREHQEWTQQTDCLASGAADRANALENTFFVGLLLNILFSDIKSPHKASPLFYLQINLCNRLYY